MRDLRGDQVSMIFQEPMTSLNPVFTCGDQIAEAVQLHTSRQPARGLGPRRRDARAWSASPTRSAAPTSYPHQLSGGMRQRVMIAMALSTDPDLLIADEPTTALDVTIQAQILELMRDLRDQNRMAIMLITHDLGVVAEMADEVVVMYAGKVVERADVRHRLRVAASPVHEGAAALDPAHGRARRAARGHQGHGAVTRSTCRAAACSSAAARTDAGVRHRAAATRRSSPGTLSRCWLTPAGEEPAVGADAEGEVAEAAAEELTVEAR